MLQCFDQVDVEFVNLSVWNEGVDDDTLKKSDVLMQISFVVAADGKM